MPVKSSRKSRTPSNIAGLIFERESLTHWKKVNDSPIDEETSCLKYVENVDETKSLWLVNFATSDALVARVGAELKVSDTLPNIFSDWLDTFESVAVGDILWVKFAMIFSDAGNNKNKIWVSNLVNN